ncbi:MULTISPECIES: hypothetical protein [Fischerella]|nr:MULTISPECIES: hypothetical protein [Fischerella]
MFEHFIEKSIKVVMLAQKEADAWKIIFWQQNSCCYTEKKLLTKLHIAI